MNNQKKSKKNAIIIFVVIVLGLLVYFYFAGSSTPSTTALDSNKNSEASQAGARVLGLLNQIQSLKIDRSIFTSSAYRTLRDFSVPIPQENVGRTNPFAPIPGVIFSTPERR